MAVVDRLRRGERPHRRARRAPRRGPVERQVPTRTDRDVPREKAKANPTRAAWRELAWNQDFAWFTKAEARQFVPAAAKVGNKQDLPVPLLNRITCAHLLDNVRGQTSPFDERQVKKARLSTEVMAVDGDVVSLRLEGETRTATEDGRQHGLDMRLLGKATFDLAKGRFLTFELVAVGSRWGGTQYNGRRDDTDAAPIGILFKLAEASPCDRVAPAFSQHPLYRPIMSDL